MSDFSSSKVPPDGDPPPRSSLVSPETLGNVQPNESPAREPENLSTDSPSNLRPGIALLRARRSHSPPSDPTSS